MSRLRDRCLDSALLLTTARIVLTLVFWTSGLSKFIDFEANAAMMDDFGLSPGWLVNSMVLTLQIGASAMIIFNRGAWLACGALGIFTLLTIPIAHPFWAKTGEAAFLDFVIALEHISLVGGLMLAAILSQRSANATTPLVKSVTIP